MSARTSMQRDVLGNTKGEASHNSSNVCTMTVAIVRIIMTIHRVAVQSPCSCDTAGNHVQRGMHPSSG